MKKISRRSFLAVCGAMAATAALTACGGSSASTAGTAASGSTAGSAASGEVFELKLSTTQTDTSMIYQGLQAAADKVAADTDGHVKVTIYPSSQLGGEEDMIDQALQGMGIAVLTDAGRLSSYVNDIGIMNMAYIVDNYEDGMKLMATDKAKHTVLPLTKFGLMQITRQRVRPVAVEEVSDVCPTCNGSGKIEPTVLLDKKIENQISFLTQDRGHKYIKLVVSPYVASFLKQGLWSLRRRWQWKYKVRLHVVADQSLGIVEVHYHDRKDNDLINK